MAQVDISVPKTATLSADDLLFGIDQKQADAEDDANSDIELSIDEDEREKRTTPNADSSKERVEVIDLSDVESEKTQSQETCDNSDIEVLHVKSKVAEQNTTSRKEDITLIDISNDSEPQTSSSQLSENSGANDIEVLQVIDKKQSFDSREVEVISIVSKDNRLPETVKDDTVSKDTLSEEINKPSEVQNKDASSCKSANTNSKLDLAPTSSVTLNDHLSTLSEETNKPSEVQRKDALSCKSADTNSKTNLASTSSVALNDHLSTLSEETNKPSEVQRKDESACKSADTNSKTDLGSTISVTLNDQLSDKLCVPETDAVPCISIKSEVSEADLETEANVPVVEVKDENYEVTENAESYDYISDISLHTKIVDTGNENTDGSMRSDTKFGSTSDKNITTGSDSSTTEAENDCEEPTKMEHEEVSNTTTNINDIEENLATADNQTVNVLPLVSTEKSSDVSSQSILPCKSIASDKSDSVQHKNTYPADAAFAESKSDPAPNTKLTSTENKTSNGSPEPVSEKESEKSTTNGCSEEETTDLIDKDLANAVDLIKDRFSQNDESSNEEFGPIGLLKDSGNTLSSKENKPESICSKAIDQTASEESSGLSEVQKKEGPDKPLEVHEKEIPCGTDEVSEISLFRVDVSDKESDGGLETETEIESLTETNVKKEPLQESVPVSSTSVEDPQNQDETEITANNNCDIDNLEDEDNELEKDDDDNDNEENAIQIEISIPMDEESTENETRKRKHASYSKTDTNGVDEVEPIPEKRTKAGENESDPEIRKLTVESRKKSVARKHTSSTNVAKSLIEIEKRIKTEVLQRRKENDSNENCSIERVKENDTEGEYDFDNHDESAPRKKRSKLKEVESNLNKIALRTEVLCKESIREIFKKLGNKLSRRQLEEIITQKFCEMISDSSEIGKLREQVHELQVAESYRKQKMLNLEKQVHQLRAVMHRYMEQVKDPKMEKFVSPVRVTRSVGLQVAIESTSNVARNTPVINNLTNSLNLNALNLKNEDKLRAALTSAGINVISVTEQKKVLSLNAKALDLKVDPRNGLPLTNGIGAHRVILPKKISPVQTESSDSTVIDLTDKDDKVESTTKPPVKTPVPNMNQLKAGTHLLVNGQLYSIGNKTFTAAELNKHPAPVPPTPISIMQPGLKNLPPKPILRIAKSESGIMLSWNMILNHIHAEIAKYQLYAYQETNVRPSVDLWKVVGDVSALPLPMACTLTQFVDGFRYHFIVRAVDAHGRLGPFSNAESIHL